MDHAEARELLDLAAVEPGGLDRLVAGDTPAATALAGHLAGCPECTEEFGRLRRATPVLRDVIASQPPPDLKERTLAFVAAVGRPRGDAPVLSPADVTMPLGPPSERDISGALPAEPVADGPGVLRRGRERRRPGRIPSVWLAAAAAIVIVTSSVTAYAVSTLRNDRDEQQAGEVAGLAKVTSWTLRLDAQPDVRRVVLADSKPGGSPGIGRLIFSPTTRQVVVVASGLSDPGPNREYRCWVEIDGTRQRLGRMYFGADLAYWVGAAAALATVAPGATFGISLADTSGSNVATPAILSGTL
jgi:hypothetical protein